MNRRSSRPLLLGTAMVATVLVVAGLAYWDAIRESEAALRELANVQAASARSLGLTLEALRAAGVDGDAQLLGILRRVEGTGSARLFIHRPGDPTLRSSAGSPLGSPRLIEALAHRRPTVRIPREEAAAFGLPARTAMAGVAYAGDQTGTLGGFLGPPATTPLGKAQLRQRDPRGVDLISVTSAEHQRDREAWARRRLLLSVGAAAGLVLLFGGVAFRMQRKELLLERELAVAGLQRRNDERLERASKAAAFGTLAIGVAHEISTPLGVIAARAEQLAPRVSGDERLASAVAAIASQAERIRQVIRGLLGLARGDAPSAERIEPGAILAGALALVRHRLESAGVPVAEAIAPALPLILGDEKLLEQAVVNLLLNACDACRAVGGSISVRAAREGGDVVILVEDSGVGISSADAERALEPFFTTKAREGGSGLGLAIAREIVSNHRGTLTLAPMPDRGTRATIRLPPAPGAA